jgi:DNA-binding beta-propeller fold protein YncE
VQPIDLATNTAGKPINLQWPPDAIVIPPDGKTAYTTNGFPSRTLTPINFDAVLDDIAVKVDQVIRAQGSFRATTHMGVFVCR